LHISELGENHPFATFQSETKKKATGNQEKYRYRSTHSTTEKTNLEQRQNPIKTGGKSLSIPKKGRLMMPEFLQKKGQEENYKS